MIIGLLISIIAVLIFLVGNAELIKNETGDPTKGYHIVIRNQSSKTQPQFKTRTPSEVGQILVKAANDHRKLCVR